ncbi:hypothetical protein H8B15_19180 [Hymenobacter sp. BT507]|uniref:STAS/SEC14 domain-containing protein n=1 Tax=Hymenobacter citatus TaxID=2763506 RepID=A0ABR7MPN9_9BACT|nr:hypothetical protein [Hymenobacter citatus]MBC6613054.1 hypothetical protein [Hymenobacter citatus]
MNTLIQARETQFYQNEAGRLLYNTIGYVHLAWSAERITQAALETFYEQVLLLLLRTGSTKVLSEHGDRRPLTAEAQQWIATNWVPRAIAEVNFTYCAIVEGADPIHRLSTQSVISISPAQLTYKRFSLMAEADAWLQSLG